MEIYLSAAFCSAVLLIAEEHSPEYHSGQRESASKPGVKYCNKFFRNQTGRAKPDPAAHHKNHYAIGFQVKKMPHRPGLLRISLDALCVLDAHFVKHRAEKAEHEQREENVACFNSRKLSV